MRNTVKQYVECRARQFMPIHPPPPKRMARDAGIAWLAATAGIDINDLKLMNPVLFVQQYVLGSREPSAGTQAFRMVHGISGQSGVGPNAAAEPWMVEMARSELAAPPVAPPVVPAAEVVQWVAEQPPVAEPPAVRLDALAETAEVAMGNAETLVFLSDRLVPVEVRMGLPVDAVPGTSQMDVIGRMLAIMAKIVNMDV